MHVQEWTVIYSAKQSKHKSWQLHKNLNLQNKTHEYKKQKPNWLDNRNQQNHTVIEVHIWGGFMWQSPPKVFERSPRHHCTNLMSKKWQKLWQEPWQELTGPGIGMHSDMALSMGMDVDLGLDMDVALGMDIDLDTTARKPLECSLLSQPVKFSGVPKPNLQ